MKLLAIQHKIYDIRGFRVMLDADLASLYGVETKRLKESVKRNSIRFPSDFMFQLTEDEYVFLRSQIASSKKQGGNRYLPYVFTEQGIAMLSSILNSEKAILMNIAIMRAFVEIRRFAIQYENLAYEIKSIKQTVSGHNRQLNQIYDVIESMLDDKTAKQEEKRKWKERTRIGYK